MGLVSWELTWFNGCEGISLDWDEINIKVGVVVVYWLSLCWMVFVMLDWDDVSLDDLGW